MASRRRLFICNVQKLNQSLKNGVFVLNRKREICAFLFYQARLKLALKRKENIEILSKFSFKLPSKNDVLC